MVSLQEYQKIVDTEWKILYEKLDLIHKSGAKVVLSKLPIGDVATQYFADRWARGTQEAFRAMPYVLNPIFIYYCEVEDRFCSSAVQMCKPLMVICVALTGICSVRGVWWSRT